MHIIAGSLAASLAAAALAAAPPPQPAQVLQLRISVDTSSTHLRNRIIERFMELLHQRTDSIEVVLYPSGQLGNDRDIPKALHWGYLDMGVVAPLKLTRFERDMNLLNLPLLYGRDVASMQRVLDGPVGRQLGDKLQRMDMQILGKTIDLGFTHTYTSSRPIRSMADYSGLKLRVPGSSGWLALMHQLGASPIVLPFPDVPMALAQGSLDGLQTSHVSALSARLWEVGLRYCYEDHSGFVNYIPLVSGRIWRTLDAAQRELLVRTWNEVAEQGRALAMESQLRARRTLLEHGIVCSAAPAVDAAQRRSLERASRQLVERLGLDRRLYELLLAELDSGG